MVPVSASGSSLHAQTHGLRCAAAPRAAVAVSTTLSAWRDSRGANSGLKQKGCGNLATLSGEGFVSALDLAPADDEHTFWVPRPCCQCCLQGGL